MQPSIHVVPPCGGRRHMRLGRPGTRTRCVLYAICCGPTLHGTGIDHVAVPGRAGKGTTRFSPASPDVTSHNDHSDKRLHPFICPPPRRADDTAWLREGQSQPCLRPAHCSRDGSPCLGAGGVRPHESLPAGSSQNTSRTVRPNFSRSLSNMTARFIGHRRPIVCLEVSACNMAPSVVCRTRLFASSHRPPSRGRTLTGPFSSFRRALPLIIPLPSLACLASCVGPDSGGSRDDMTAT